ncbi:GNAT family N-acetyltransferase [Candidatus Saccharibacteria bacterium]|nr:GNAT family N-acetyltransferase [Candidatus Saccharibacteria bacterium]MCA9337334.1 GNAT family N-acetyltransferase [Candidatus Saccharibacteria bacterium]
MIVRRYKPEDYAQLKALYLDSSLYGGQFDEARDGSDRLQKKIEADPDSILVAEENGKLTGTVSLIDDGRVAWLFRFAVSSAEVATALHDKAIEVLKSRGHTQVLVYTPAGNNELDSRYEKLGFTKGGDYTCYWKEV